MSSIITTSMAIVVPITIPSPMASLAVGIMADVVAMDSVLCTVFIDTNVVLAEALLNDIIEDVVPIDGLLVNSASIDSVPIDFILDVACISVDVVISDNVLVGNVILDSTLVVCLVYVVILRTVRRKKLIDINDNVGKDATVNSLFINICSAYKSSRKYVLCCVLNWAPPPNYYLYTAMYYFLPDLYAHPLKKLY